MQLMTTVNRRHLKGVKMLRVQAAINSCSCVTGTVQYPILGSASSLLIFQCFRISKMLSDVYVLLQNVDPSSKVRTIECSRNLVIE